MSSPLARTAHPTALVLATFILAACAGVQPTAGDGEPHRFQPWEEVPAERADVGFDMADGVEVVAARRRIGLDGVQIYEVAFTNRTLDFGENKVIVTTRDRVDDRPLALEPEIVAFEFTPAVVERNLGLLLKGARRTSEPRARRNRYGPYQFVAAEYPASSQCVYAWQTVDGGFAARRSGGDAAIQFRFCDPERDAASLIEMFDRIIIDL